jgi:hypothetical protein
MKHKIKRGYLVTLQLKLKWYLRQREYLIDMGRNNEVLNERIRSIQSLILDY